MTYSTNPVEKEAEPNITIGEVHIKSEHGFLRTLDVIKSELDLENQRKLAKIKSELDLQSQRKLAKIKSELDLETKQIISNLQEASNIESELADDFECDLCKETFQEKIFLSNHLKKAHDESKPYKCVTCHKTYAAKSSLTGHTMNIHLKVKQCQICNISFRNAKKRDHHMIEVHKHQFCCKECSFVGAWSKKLRLGLFSISQF